MANPDNLDSPLASLEKAEQHLKTRFENVVSSLSSETEKWIPESIRNMMVLVRLTLQQSTMSREVTPQFTLGTAPEGGELEFETIDHSNRAILRVDEKFFSNLSEYEQEERLVVAASKVYDFISGRYCKVRSEERADMHRKTWIEAQPQALSR